MIAKRIQEKGILSRLLEQGIRILLIKECKSISNLRIDIISNSTQIIKGEIKRLNIIAEDINYKDLLFDEFKLEANRLKINFKLTNKELYFKNNPIIKFKVSLSQKSLKKVLLYSNWNWVEDMISKEILNQDKLEDIKIKDDTLTIIASKKNKTIIEIQKINIKTEKGKIYLENNKYNKTVMIPIEDKIYIENVNIDKDLINIFANSSISF